MRNTIELERIKSEVGKANLTRSQLELKLLNRNDIINNLTSDVIGLKSAIEKCDYTRIEIADAVSKTMLVTQDEIDLLEIKIAEALQNIQLLKEISFVRSSGNTNHLEAVLKEMLRSALSAGEEARLASKVTETIIASIESMVIL